MKTILVLLAVAAATVFAQSPVPCGKFIIETALLVSSNTVDVIFADSPKNWEAHAMFVSIRTHHELLLHDKNVILAV